MKKELYLEIISEPTLTVGVLMTCECEVQRSKSYKSRSFTVAIKHAICTPG